MDELYELAGFGEPKASGWAQIVGDELRALLGQPKANDAQRRFLRLTADRPPFLSTPGHSTKDKRIT
jgi:hypothetical protein